jgi:hypothetical protein
MRILLSVVTCGVVILAAGGAPAEDKAMTAGGSGQNQAAPSSEAKAPVVPKPGTAATAGGPGQNQAAPSSEAKSPTAIAPAAGAGEGCPAGQVLRPGGGCAPGQ